MNAIAKTHAPERVTEPVEVVEIFKTAMSRLAAGVVMVTCHVDGKPWGLTVSACCSVSMSPPLILVSLGTETTSARAITEKGWFGVNLLGESLISVARFGAARGQPKFVEEHCHEGDQSTVSPIVAGAIAAIDCAVEQIIRAGDHTLFIGAVTSVLTRPDDRPLVYYSRDYHCLRNLAEMTVGPPAEEALDSLLHDHPFPRTHPRTRPLTE